MKPYGGVIVICLLLATCAQSQEPDCGWWDLTREEERIVQPWKTATVERVIACLKAGANPNVRSQYGEMPLHWAASNNDNPAVIKALLKAGADLQARGRLGRTPLHGAAVNDNPAVIEALLKAGADLNARDELDETPLHEASSNDNPAIIEALLDAGADPNARDRRGKTLWDLVQVNERLKGSAAYWKLNDARFKAP